MYKCIALLKRKAGLSRGDLIDYYETRHAPLILRLMPQIREYRRNFVDPSSAFRFGGAPDFDVVTELWFDDRAGLETFSARYAEPEIARQIAEDEEKMFDRSATRMFVVEERCGPSANGLGDDEAVLRALQDEREILRRLGRFARVLETKDFSALGDIFAHDLVFDYGQGGDQHGMAALEAWMHRSLDVCGGTQHLLGNITVDVEGDRAVSRAYVQARHQRVNELGGPIFDANGEYFDQWERRPEGWRIVRRDARWYVFHGDPAIVGIERLRLD